MVEFKAAMKVSKPKMFMHIRLGEIFYLNDIFYVKRSLTHGRAITDLTEQEISQMQQVYTVHITICKG